MALSPSDYPEYTASISNKTQPPLGFGVCPALLVLDICKAYFTSSSPLSLLSSTCPTSGTILSQISALVQAAREGKCPVIWTRTQFRNRDLKDAGLWGRKIGSPLSMFVEGEENYSGDWLDLEGLQPRVGISAALPDAVITKKFVSAFFGTNLQTQLQMLNVDTLIICGVCTSGEVRQTALDAMQSGFRPIIVGNACADRTRETHLANLFDIRAKIGDVCTVDEAGERLRSG